MYDPTHKHFFTEETLKYFCKDQQRSVNWYARQQFILRKAELISFKGNQGLHFAIRNLVPFRKILTKFFWNMYDGVHFELVKPVNNVA